MQCTHLHSGCHQRHTLEEANNPSEDQEDDAVNRPRRSITMGAIGDEKKGEKEAFPLPLFPLLLSHLESVAECTYVRATAAAEVWLATVHFGKWQMEMMLHRECKKRTLHIVCLCLCVFV